MQRKDREEIRENVRQVVRESVEALRQCNPKERIREAAKNVSELPNWKANEEMARFTKQFEQDWAAEVESSSL